MTENNNSDADESTTTNPKPDELWTIYIEEQDTERVKVSERTAIVRVEEQVLFEDVEPNPEPHFSVELLWDTAKGGMFEGKTIVPVPLSRFHSKLPDDEMTEKHRDCLEVLSDYLTPNDIADLLDGEPSYVTAGRSGYQAARHAVLDGIDTAIQEGSRLQGHGPTRYAKAVQNQIHGLPEWIQQSVLRAEQDIWEGGMPFTDDDAARIVELLQLREQHLDEDNEDEISELVNEYNLAYDEYLDGFLTAMDCPHCGEELIERPDRENGYIPLDCSGCDKQYDGVVDDEGLLVYREITEGDDA